ncbi:MAG: alcohol dehydrogenase catalytic domain-containing protein [Rhodobiaceae bacterium]|nr:alcohol dehydrogenase catalytic domain-containing protein [Rhodobiaceae bacterium]MCC0056056.1 alcohol dehydrogenase catalytic domain-containing protein [Rhodobiaceae bacterium]
MKVEAAFALRQKTPIQLATLTLEKPGEREVLIEMKAAGLCHSDMMLFDGTRMEWQDYPLVLGHEGAGIVREVGPGVTTVKPGDHVIPVPIPECGECTACLSGKTNLCDRYYQPPPRPVFSLDGKSFRSFCELGTFAQYITVREMQVAKIRDDVPLDIVCCLGCAGATGLGAAIFTAEVASGSSVVVFGLGGIGLNVVNGAKLNGASMIIGVDTNPTKRQAAFAAGATHYVNPKDHGDNLIGVLKEMTGGGADYAFECVGSAKVLSDTVECTRLGWGTAVTIGILPTGEQLQLRPRAIQEGRKLMGSYLGNIKSRSQLPILADWYAEGKLALDDLISHRIALSEIASGFDLLRDGKARRVVIEF